MSSKPPDPSKSFRDAQARPGIRVALLGEGHITRAGLRMLIDREAGLHVVWEGEPLHDPGTMLAVEQPDVTLLDVDHSNCDLIPDLIARLAKKTRIVVLTNSSDADLISSAFWSGAKGLVRKDQTPTVLLNAIRKVHAGEVWLDRSMTARLLGNLSHGVSPGGNEAAKIGCLTPRERQLITVVGQGFSNSEIADRLHISEATVRNHLTSIFRKLELHSRFELVMHALRHGLIQAPPSRTRLAKAQARRPSRIKSAS